MANRGISLSLEQRRTLAAIVERHGAQAVCEAAEVSSAQSLYRALSGATVLRMTAAALLASCERLALSDTSARPGVPQ